MSIAQSILANPSKYSLAQLTQGVQNGVIPAYIGIPIIQEKMQEQARMQSMGQGQQAAQPPVAEQIMAQAQQGSQGVESLSSNLPESYAGGGIIAFEEGGPVERFQVGGTPAGRLPVPGAVYSAANPNVAFADFLRQLGMSTTEFANARPEAQRQISDMFRSGTGAPAATPAATTAPATSTTPQKGVMFKAGQLANTAKQGVGNFMSRGLADLVGGRVLGGLGLALTPSALGDDQAVLAAMRGEEYQGRPYSVENARKVLEGAGIDPNRAPAAPAAMPYDPATATRRSQYPEAPPAPLDGGIATLPGAGQPTTAPAAPAQTPFVMPAAPTGKSAEDFARTQFAGLGERSDARMEKLLAAQAANKMEGKAFDGLKKTLEDEAAQAGVEKSDAKAMAIFKAGLAIMGGTSTNALENISRGALAGAEDLQKANADLKKAEKERQRQFAAIEEARRAEDRDDIKTRNARLETAYKAGQRMDELGSAAISAGFGVDKTEGMGIWKTQFSAAATQRAAETGAAATRYSADRSADSRVQAAELRAALLAGGGAKGAFTQDQLFKNRQALAESPQIIAYKQDLVKQFGKNVVNQPGYQEDINRRIDELLMQMSAQPGAGPLQAFMAQNPSLAQYFK
jgi:hypothetical protein